MKIKVLNDKLIVFCVRNYSETEVKDYIKEESKSYEEEHSRDVVPLRQRDHIMHDFIMPIKYFIDNMVSIEPVVEEIDGIMNIVSACTIYFKNNQPLEVEHSLKEMLEFLDNYYNNKYGLS